MKFQLSSVAIASAIMVTIPFPKAHASPEPVLSMISSTVIPAEAGRLSVQRAVVADPADSLYRAARHARIAAEAISQLRQSQRRRNSVYAHLRRAREAGRRVVRRDHRRTGIQYCGQYQE